MRLPPAAPAKTPHERVKVNQAIQEAAGSAQSLAPKEQQSHSSSFITDRKVQLKDSKDGDTSNLLFAAGEEGEDQSVTVTTFHNGAALIDGAFKEEVEAEFSQSLNLNRPLNQTGQQTSLSGPQGAGEEDERTIDREGSQVDPSSRLERADDQGTVSESRKPAEENMKQDLAAQVPAGREFDLSRVDADEGAVSDSEQ